MNFLEVASKIVQAIQYSVALIAQATKTLTLLQTWLKIDRPEASYENVSLELVVDIPDPEGGRAIVKRKQRVRFMVGDSGVIHNLVWGEGRPIAQYRVESAQRLMVRREGSKRVVLLGLAQTPRRGGRATVVSQRLIERGFTESKEYFETLVERPTQRLTMKVLFPRLRPPQEALLVAVPSHEAPRKMPIYYTPGGRACVSWSRRRPVPYCIYSLRWSW